MTSKIIPLSFVLLNLENGNEGEKVQKMEYLETERSFSDETKTFFIVFEEPLFGEKNKNLIKNSGHKL